MEEDQNCSPVLLLSLPNGCKHSIFQFLCLKDCLSYGGASKMTLNEILSSLVLKRKHEFLKRYQYQIEHPSRLKPVDEENLSTTTTQPTNEKGEDNDLGRCCSKLVNKHHWHTIPSVYERIQSLYRTMPNSHPSNDKIRELLLDLKKQELYRHRHQDNNTLECNLQFTSTLHQLRRITKAHKLNATILAQSTIRSNPTPCNRYSNFANTAATNTNSNNSRRSLSISLDQYVGDVLIACYLMGHAVAGIVDDGTTSMTASTKTIHSRWTKHILNLVTTSSPGEPYHSKSWYQFFIYLHSTLLRIFPLTPDQMKTLLGSASGIIGQTIPHHIEYIHPHYCYVGRDELKLVSDKTNIVRTLMLQLGDEGNTRFALHRVAHQTTMNQFGPLGPAFRGRDEIRTVIMNPFSLLQRLHHPSYVIPTTWFSDEQKEHVIMDSRAFNSWFTGVDSVMRWMLALKLESQKTRPMTVSPPIVTIEPVPMSAFLADNAIG